MAQATHSVNLALSNDIAWNFLKDYQNWAPLIPGYIAHEVENDSKFTWIFVADLGFTKKTMKLEVNIAELIEPSDVKFSLKGPSENLDGNGYFNISSSDNENVQITGSLDLSAGGIMGRMINSVLETFLPKATTDLINSIEEKLTQLHQVK